jgi:hypothetical protein
MRGLERAGAIPRFVGRTTIMIKRFVLAAVLAVAVTGTAYAGYNCTTSCYWLGNTKYCNTSCY